MGDGLLLSRDQVSDDGKYTVFLPLSGCIRDCLSQVYWLASPQSLAAKLNIPNDLIDKEHIQSTGMSHMLNHLTHIERFENEVAILKQLHHPNIISLHDTTYFDGLPAIVFALETDYHKNFWINYPIQHLDKIEPAIYYLRHKGIAHKDIRPMNMTKSKLIDFGIACRFEDDNGLYFNRMFRPPEFDDCRLHKNSDIYSYGLVIINALLEQLIIRDWYKSSPKCTYIRVKAKGFLEQLQDFVDKGLFPETKDIDWRPITYYEDFIDWSKDKNYPGKIKDHYNEYVDLFSHFYKKLEEVVSEGEIMGYYGAFEWSPEGVWSRKLLERCRYYLNPDPDKRIPPKELLTEELLKYMG
ncbi:protein kinase [Candidatus Woesearchaeota archaeon]|nr:protein kinase [Candidatus Woesearchaeota archaeon]